MNKINFEGRILDRDDSSWDGRMLRRSLKNRNQNDEDKRVSEATAHGQTSD